MPFVDDRMKMNSGSRIGAPLGANSIHGMGYFLKRIQPRIAQPLRKTSFVAARPWHRLQDANHPLIGLDLSPSRNLLNHPTAAIHPRRALVLNQKPEARDASLTR